MRKKKNLNQNSNIKFALIFFAIVVFVIAISLVVKTILIIQKSQYDSSKRFTISVYGNNALKVMSFSPISQSLSVLNLEKIDPKNTGRFLEIPIDGFINSNLLEEDERTDSFFLKSILNYGNLKTNLTILDMVKLFIFTKTIPSGNINIRNIQNDLGIESVDIIVNKLVKDELIEKDNKTIQIINGTEISGLGNRLARLVTNMGGNVIIVTTSDVPRKKSSISYFDKKTFTVEKLEKILGFEVIQVQSKNIADITIIIGEDRVDNIPF